MLDCWELSIFFREIMNKNGLRKCLLLIDDFYVKEYLYIKWLIIVKILLMEFFMK